MTAAPVREPAGVRAGRVALPGGPVMVLDPGLFFEGGHHAAFARAFSAECAARGGSTVFYGARRIDRPDPLVGLEVRGHFRVSSYATLDRASPAESLAGLNEGALLDLRAIPHARFREAGLILFPTITSRIALGVARWVRGLPEDIRTPIAMFMMFPPGWSGQGLVRQAEEDVYREAMRELAASSPGRVTLLAETGPIARVFEGLGAPRVRMTPWPVMLDGPVGAPARCPTGGMRAHVVQVGYTKPDKGMALLADAAPGILRARPGVRFTVQINSLAPAGVEEPARRLESLGPGVRTVRGPLGPRAYADLLRSADIVALPYHPEHYRGLGSGVFAEAAALGKVVVAPDQTWMAEQAGRWGLGAVLFDRYDAGCFGDALGRAVDGLDALLARAREARPAWAARHSPASFLDAVLHAFPACGAVMR